MTADWKLAGAHVYLIGLLMGEYNHNNVTFRRLLKSMVSLDLRNMRTRSGETELLPQT